MTDHRIFDAFRLLDEPEAPDAAYADRLFGELVVELGFVRPVAIVPRRGFRAAGRLLYVAATIGLLLALVAAGAFVASRLLTRSAAEIVKASQQTQLAPPPYDMTVRIGDLTLRVRVSQGTWRWDWIDNPEVPAGTYEVHVDHRVGRFDPSTQAWELGSETLWIIDASPLHWQRDPEPSQTQQPPDWITCPAWIRLDDDVIAGRPAYHVACDEREFWVDQETSLLVGIEVPDDGSGSEVHGRATALTLLPAASEAFTVDTPAGAVVVDSENPPAFRRLSLGRTAPQLTGETLDGDAFDTARLDRPMVVYFWTTWCVPCLDEGVSRLQPVALRHVTDVATVTIASWDQRRTVVDWASTNNLRLPIVIDPGDGALAQAWGLSGVPALAAIARDGTVAAMRFGPVPDLDLEQIYSDLAAGRPIPSAAPTPTPSDCACGGGTGADGEQIFGLALGDAMPDWSGPLLGGGTMTTADLLGKPSIIWFHTDVSERHDGRVDTFDAVARLAGDTANLVIISGGEPTPGRTADEFARRSITTPLVFDWDQRISRLFQVNQLDAVIAFDADGRAALETASISEDLFLEFIREYGPPPTLSP